MMDKFDSGNNQQEGARLLMLLHVDGDFVHQDLCAWFWKMALNRAMPRDERMI